VSGFGAATGQATARQDASGTWTPVLVGNPNNVPGLVTDDGDPVGAGRQHHAPVTGGGLSWPQRVVVADHRYLCRPRGHRADRHPRVHGGSSARRRRRGPAGCDDDPGGDQRSRYRDDDRGNSPATTLRERVSEATSEGTT
jgi:hypothetical protein